MLKCILMISLYIFLSGCKSPSPSESEYIEDINQWHNKRIERLKSENGWLNLVGRSWLKIGTNRFGSAKDNDVVIESEKVPPYIGEFIYEDSIVKMKVYDNVTVLLDGKPVKEVLMIDDQKPDMTVFQCSTIKWNLIVRDSLVGVRFRDLESANVKNFPGIERFPVSLQWRIKGSFQHYNPPKEILVPNVLGQIKKELSPGAVVFQIDEKIYKIDALEENDKLFLIFADKTSGEETYGGGRFLYVDKADSNGNIIVDFNKAYNPPCVFTKFATCPLPPQQNYLNVRIEAGEKNFNY